jgi:hypothetical protein
VVSNKSWDVLISFTNQDIVGIKKKAFLKNDQVNLFLQIKEHFDYSKQRNEYDIEFISKKINQREDEFFLFFNRDLIISTQDEEKEINKFLQENKNICIISMIGSVKNEKGEELTDKNKFNFLLRTGNNKDPLVFDIPDFLKKLP